MNNERLKPGETKSADLIDYVWLRALLRYTRNAEMGTNVPDDVPNMTTLFCGFTSTYRPGELTLLFKSYLHTDHATVIIKSLATRDSGEPLKANVSLKVLNSLSPEMNLMMKGWAEPIVSDEISPALAAYNRVRLLKGDEEKTLGPKNDEDTSEILFAVKVLHAQTQSRRLSSNNNHIGEGHPPIIIQKLLGFEDLPRLGKEQPVPRTKIELKVHLERKGYPTW